jgi:hypothetical protein
VLETAETYPFAKTVQEESPTSLRFTNNRCLYLSPNIFRPETQWISDFQITALPDHGPFYWVDYSVFKKATLDMTLATGLQTLKSYQVSLFSIPSNQPSERDHDPGERLFGSLRSIEFLA